MGLRVVALAAASALALCALPALAQEPVAGAEASNVTPYPASFFAEYRPITAMDMIGRIPGFSFDGGSGGRGFSGNEGNVLIDGARPASRSDSVFDVVARIPAESVERIDVIRGGAPGIDMQGKPIVANIIRRKGSSISGSAEVNGDIDLQGETSGYAKVQAQRQKDGRVADGSLSYNTSDGVGRAVRERRLVDGSLDELALFRGAFPYEKFSLTGAYETPFAGGRLRVNGEAAVQHDGFSNLDVLRVPGGSNVSHGVHGERSGEAGLRWSRKIAGDYSIDLVGFQSLEHDDSSNESTRPAFTNGSLSKSDHGESIGSVNLHSPTLGNWKFDAGTELSFNWTESTITRTIDGAPLSLAGDHSRVEELRSETSVSATWTASNTLNLETGVRYERSTISAGPVENTLGFVKPRAILSWTPKPDNQFTFRVERTVDQLSFGAFQSSVSFNSTLGQTIFGIGNNDIRPASTWLGEARYERRWGNKGSFHIDVRRLELDDVLGRTIVASPTPQDPARTFEIQANIGRATRRALDMGLEAPLDRFGLEGGLFSLSFTAWWSSITDPVTHTSRRMSDEAPFDWYVSLSRDIRPGSNIGWSIYYDSGFGDYSYSPQGISRFVFEGRAGASVTWRPRDVLSITAGVSNIAAKATHGSFVFYSAPRNVGVPVYFEKTQDSDAQSAFVTVRRTF